MSESLIQRLSQLPKQTYESIGKAFWNFRTDPVPEYHRISLWKDFDIEFIVLMAVMLFCIRKLISKFILEPIADRLKVQGKQKQRLVENGWFGLYYPAMVVFGFIALHNTPWLTSLENIYSGFPSEHLQDQYRYPLLKYYCYTALAFYTQALFTLLFIDERMKDFKEMVIHHISTIILLSFSMITLYHRSGTVIIFLHDIADIFLYNAKFYHALKCQMIANICFFSFTVTFFVTRLIWYPIIIFSFVCGPWFKTYESFTFLFAHLPNINSPLGIEVSSFGICVFNYCISSMYLLGGFLFLLLALHIYWFNMIVKLLIRTLTIDKGNISVDPRVEDNENMEEKASDVKQLRKSSQTRKDNPLRRRDKQSNSIA